VEPPGSVSKKETTKGADITGAAHMRVGKKLACSTRKRRRWDHISPVKGKNPGRLPGGKRGKLTVKSRKTKDLGRPDRHPSGEPLLSLGRKKQSRDTVPSQISLHDGIASKQKLTASVSIPLFDLILGEESVRKDTKPSMKRTPRNKSCEQA